MASVFNISKIVSYVASAYPVLNANLSTFWTNELRKIQTALNSTQQLQQSAQFGVTPNAGVPSTAQLSKGASGIFKDTSGGGVYLAYNDGGTIKKVALT